MSIITLEKPCNMFPFGLLPMLTHMNEGGKVGQHGKQTRRENAARFSQFNDGPAQSVLTHILSLVVYAAICLFSLHTVVLWQFKDTPKHVI